MFRIDRVGNGETVLKLSGRLNEENLGELKKLIGSEMNSHHIVLDLKDLTIVDRDSVRYLKACEADGIKLKNCPGYIRQWIDGEKDAL